MPSSTKELLDRSRKELLDLSTRNRLLSIPVNSKSARIVEVHDELSEQVFRLLVSEKKSLSFRPGQQTKAENSPNLFNAENTNGTDDDEAGLPQPDDEENAAPGLAKRHVDSRLQTALSSEGLQRRLLDFYRNAQAMVEEQGVNILYLVLGHLKWFEAEQADTPRYAPLILIPVELERKTASDRFQLKWREEDIQENLSLAAKLKTDFDIALPPFPDEEDFSPTAYFKEVAETIEDAKGWEVLPNAITLGFFSFAKFLMYRDLDPANWPEGDLLLKHPFITGLLQDGFPKAEQMFGDDVHLDELIPASRLDHVVDADSSQTLALEAARQGRSLVIQGPPGTGKSQSITNIIAGAVLDGKRVLFVAEKLAALQVVKRRLEKEGLGDLCLELHSNKANKRAVIEEIGRTWKLGRPKSAELDALVAKLELRRSILNKHATSLHERHEPSGLTPFVIMGQLALLGNDGREAADIVFPASESWTPEDRAERRQLAEELAARIEDIGLPTQHPWRGVCRETVLKIDLDLLEGRIASLAGHLDELRQTSAALASNLSQPVPVNFVDVEEQRIIAGYVAKAPPVDKQSLCNGVWNGALDRLRELLEEGREFAAATVEAKALAGELPEGCADRLGLAGSIIRSVVTRLGELRETSTALAAAIALPIPVSFTELDQLCAIADHVAKAPSVDKQALCNSVWNGDLDDIQSLVAVGRKFAATVAEIGKQVAEEGFFSYARLHCCVRSLLVSISQ